MPIVMTIIACSVMVIMQMMSSGFFASKTQVYQRERTMAEKREAIRLAGPLVRDAFELYQRAGSTCPAGTIRKRLGSQYLCWRNSGDDGQCVRSTRAKNPLWVCPAETSTDNLAILNLFLLEAHATEVIVTPRNPLSGGGVFLQRPACGPQRPCVRCSDSNTTCLTVRFCVSETPNQFNCPAAQRVTQTFAFRRDQ